MISQLLMDVIHKSIDVTVDSDLTKREKKNCNLPNYQINAKNKKFNTKNIYNDGKCVKHLSFFVC